MRWLVMVTVFTGCATSNVDKMAWSLSSVHVAGDTPVTDIEESPPAPKMSSTGQAEAQQSAGQPSDTTQLELIWPVAVIGINSLYGERIDPIDGQRRFHCGVDLDAVYGSVVKAAAAGRVVHADWALGHGRQVVIEHRGGVRTVYSHLSRVLVFPGTTLGRGAAIGQVGNSGRSTGPHLHFEVTKYDEYMDPLEALNAPLPIR